MGQMLNVIIDEPIKGFHLTLQFLLALQSGSGSFRSVLVSTTTMVSQSTQSVLSQTANRQS